MDGEVTERQGLRAHIAPMQILTKLRRSFDVQAFNNIANHAEVRPWLGGRGPLDFSAIVGDPSNVCLLGDGIGFMAHKLSDGLYEVHTLALPHARGANAFECGREGMRYMFAATDCVELVTKCPDGNRGAMALACAAGFREVFRREAAFDDGSLEAKGISYRKANLDDWRMGDPALELTGTWFHDKLEAAKVAAGSNLDIHPDDAAHNCAVGASVLMVMAGNPRKAVWAYNRWAIFAGYAPITLISEAPVIVDVVDAIVAPRGDDMEVLLCRQVRSQALPQ